MGGNGGWKFEMVLGETRELIPGGKEILGVTETLRKIAEGEIL